MAAATEPTKVKVLVIGNSGVGKTSLLCRFCDETEPSPNVISTVGVDFKYKVVSVDGTKMRLQIWDTAGQERYRVLTNSFYRGCVGIVLVYDVTDEDSFHQISDLWMPKLLELSGSSVPRVLVGNKTDLASAHRQVPTRMGEGAADEFGMPFFETSAKSGDGVEAAFMSLAALIKERVLDPIADQRANLDSDNVLSDIAGDSGGTSRSSKGCCS